jgi:membrane protein
MLHHARTAFSFLMGLKNRTDQANLSLVAAGGAFFAMLSIFPGLGAVIALLGFLASPEIVDDQLHLLEDFMPGEAFALMQDQIQRLVRTSSSTLGWATGISTLAALWSARRGTDAVIRAVNTVYGAPMRGGVRAMAVAFLITLALTLVVVVAILTMLVLPVTLTFLPLGPYAGFALEVARWLLALAVVLSGIWVLYRFAPNTKGARVRWLNTGAILAVLVWGGASWAFSYFLANFGNYNQVYGSIGAVIALLMFLYITIFVVLLGASVNAEIFDNARRRAAAQASHGAVPPDAPPNDPETPGPEASAAETDGDDARPAAVGDMADTGLDDSADAQSDAVPETSRKIT